MTQFLFRILLIENDSSETVNFRQKLSGGLGGSLEMYTEKSLAAGMDQAAKIQPSAIFVDMHLPEGKDVEAISKLHERFPGIPILAISREENERLALEVMREGAQDFLVKEQCSPEKLKQAFLFSVERKKVELEIARLASFAWQNPNAILECDFSGQILYLNPAGQRLFPELQQMKQHPFLENLESAAAEMDLGSRAFGTREIQIGEKWYEQHISCVPERKVLRSYIADITERKKTEEALKVRNQEVERMNRVMVGRELKMAELKKKIAELEKEFRDAA